MRRAIAIGCVLCGLWAAPVSSSASAQDAPSPISTIAVTPDAAGGVRAAATLHLPAPLDAVQALLTDYRRWPELFDVHMRLAGLEEQQGRVVTDLYIAHALMPGERRLLCESKVLPGGGLVTKLRGGDFKRYHRVWTLKPEEAGTRAEFELVVEIETVVPDWLVAMAMRRELEAHFRIVRERLLTRGHGEK